MIGRAISHYRVISTLGAGGMGVVYLAEDERLGRQVALKFLPAEAVSSRHALDRFRVEARAASSLSHPGICAVYDIGEEDGAPYIVMEALKGESLRDRINRGPMKALDLLDVGIQLADALDAAHTQGIIHRDIKPSNIFVGDKNRSKILDFGLAKLSQTSPPLSSGAATMNLNQSTHRDLTIPGSALGTVSYMSPEQARGEEVDTRTDLFSLGVVLYEMATGVQAFGGSTPAVVFDAILNRAPQPITHLNPLIPARLEALIATTLEKDRDLRHQHASDLEAELKRIRRDFESGSLAAVTTSRSVNMAATLELPSARASSMPYTPPAEARRSAWRYGVAAAAVIAVAAIGFYVWSTRSAEVPLASNNGSTAPTQTVAPPPVTTPSAPDLVPLQPPPATLPPEASTAQTGRGAQPAQIAKPSPVEVRTPTPQPATTPQRGGSTPPPPSAASTPVAVTPSTPAPQTPANNEGANAAVPTTTAPAPAPAAPVAEPPPVVQPAPRAAASALPPPLVPPTSPVESDDAAIRGVLRTYERAIETKNADLFRSVRPGLSAAEEARLRESFRQVDSQQVDITVDELRVEGRTATVRLSRRDTFVTGGRRQMQSSRQMLRFEKTGTSWIITAIGQ